MSIQSELVCDYLKSEVEEASYSEKLSSELSLKVALRLANNFRDIQTLETLLSVYNIILPDASEDELSRVGSIIVDKVPRINEETKKDDLFDLYSYYLLLFINLEKWTNVDRKILATLFIDIVFCQHTFQIDKLYQVVSLVEKKLLMAKDMRELLLALIDSVEQPYDLISSLGLEQADNSDKIVKIVQQIIAENPKEAQQFRDGNQKIIGFFVGRIMKSSTEKLNPAEVNRILKEEINK